MKQTILMMLAVLSVVFFAQDRAQADLWQQKAERDQAQRAAAHAQANARQHRELLAGLEKHSPSGIAYDTLKCSDGWDSGDFSYAVEQVCSQRGCMTIYARNPQNYDGFIFTCNFNLRNGSECHAESYVESSLGYSVNCINTQLKESNYSFLTK